MARQKGHVRWWPASTWLPLLLISTTSLAWASGADEAPMARRIDTRETVKARAANLEGDKVADFFRRLAAPLVAAAAEPNVMATDALEQKQQMLRALERDQESQELRRRAAEEKEMAVEVRATPPAARAAPGAGMAAREPTQTAPASLGRRQNDDSGQIAALSAQIQSLSLVASSISQASRSVSQTSQQLAQQVTQLSQSTDRLSVSINSLQNSAQQAQQSAQEAQDSARQASQSASSAVSSAMSSAASSASAVISSNLASVSSSAAGIIAAASASALNIQKAASSQVQSAQADATIARADAASQVQKAQGTAVSVTQVALAIVGTFFGSSLLTIGAFYLIFRYKSKKRRRTRLIATRGIGYPRQQDGRKGDDDDADDAGAYGYPIDLKDPPRRSLGGEGDGFDERRPDAAYLQDAAGAGNRGAAEKGNLGAGFGFAAFGSGSSGSVGRDGGGAAGANNNNETSFSLFPKTPTGGGDARASEQQVVSPSIYATGTSAMTSTTLARAITTVNNPTKPPPSLQQWLREGTVSPFGTLRRNSRDMRGANGNGSEPGPAGGPLERKQQQLRAMMKRSMGVGGVNAGGGSTSGRVMQPGGLLPLRDS